MKRPSQESNEFREFTVVLEGIRSEFKLFAEDLGFLKNKVNMIFEKVGQQEEQIYFIRTDIRILKEDVRTLKEDVGTLKEDMKTVKTTLGSIDDRTSRLEEAAIK